MIYQKNKHLEGFLAKFSLNYSQSELACPQPNPKTRFHIMIFFQMNTLI